ncbi:acetyltransferase-like protein [Actinoplanes awajinensis]|uniref:Acetyltransferase-like protein n=1 Tax=Actinoplanes awajinensis subsp. mycoplanecinus TaxID=135947 RepID=A0A0X3UT70_9ACTN|nr:acetyltransferase-like protein [Actinoplanes awajinensis]KUL35791.1 acetyltransferase-like protein [Actinoplanes awajinensis subsp. mycoplanecinus]
MDLDIAPVGDRTEIMEQLTGLWPEFMRHDPTSGLYYRHDTTFWPDFTLLAVDRETGEAVAKAHSVPISFDGAIADGLPEGGWDWAIRTAAHDRLSGTTPTIVSALEIAVRPDLRAQGISGLMLAAMRENAVRHGFTDLVAPVRPTGKAAFPDEPIDEYAFRQRPDGLPVDPWLRVHVRAGGVIVNVAHHSMMIPGTLAQWRDRTGLPFDKSGPVPVPGALSDVHCSVEHDHAVYVEPNVWVHHPL